MKNLTKNITLTLIVICTMSLVPTTLTAQDMPLRGPIPFEVFDADKNGFISESELNNARAKRMENKASQGLPMRNAANAPTFDALDSNKDGKINKLELLEGQNKQMKKNRANRGPKNNR